MQLQGIKDSIIVGHIFINDKYNDHYVLAYKDEGDRFLVKEFNIEDGKFFGEFYFMTRNISELPKNDGNNYRLVGFLGETHEIKIIDLSNSKFWEGFIYGSARLVEIEIK